MFDFGFIELIVILAAGVVIVGPKELPALMQGAGRLVRRFQYIRYAFTRQFEDFMDSSDLKDIQSQVNFEAKDFNEEEADEEFLDELYPDSELKQDEKESKATQISSRRIPGSIGLEQSDPGLRRDDKEGALDNKYKK